VFFIFLHNIFLFPWHNTAFCAESAAKHQSANQLVLLSEWWEGHPPVKFRVSILPWFGSHVWDSVITAANCIISCCSKSRMVWHSGNGLRKLSWINKICIVVIKMYTLSVLYVADKLW